MCLLQVAARSHVWGYWCLPGATSLVHTRVLDLCPSVAKSYKDNIEQAGTTALHSKLKANPSSILF